MVTIPALGKVPYCPVKAMRRYLKYRNARVDKTRVLPLYMTEHLWVAGSSKPNKSTPGFYTAGRFRKDVEFAVRDLSLYYPALAAVYEWLVLHSLRSGLVS